MKGLDATRFVSYEEFLRSADEETWAESVEGRVVTLSPASDRHQDLVVPPDHPRGVLRDA